MAETLLGHRLDTYGVGTNGLDPYCPLCASARHCFWSTRLDHNSVHFMKSSLVKCLKLKCQRAHVFADNEELSLHGVFANVYKCPGAAMAWVTMARVAMAWAAMA